MAESNNKNTVRLIIDTLIYVAILAYIIYFWIDCSSGDCYFFTKYGTSGFIRFSDDPVKFFLAVSIKSSLFILIIYFGFKDVFRRWKKYEEDSD